MSFSLRRRATSPASNEPSSRASWAWMAIWKRRSPSSSRRRSRAVAGTRATPAGHRARSTSSAAAAPGGSEGGEAPFDELLELEARDEPRDVVRLLLLIQPVRVRVVLDLLLLVVIERPRVVLFEHLVPDGLRAVVVLLAPRSGVEREQLVLGTDVGEHPARDPAHVATLVLGVAGLRAAALLDLDDVVAELRLHRVGHLPELHGGRGVLELLHELALADPAELAP